jgi:hypothetical protein
MRHRRILVLAAVGVATVAFFGDALAQAVGGAPPNDDTAAGLKKQVQLTPEEMRTKSSNDVAVIGSAADVVRKDLATARSKRDVVKTLCLNDKLNQLDVTMRSAQERHKNLEGALARSDNELASHEFTVLGVYRKRADKLSAEAKQCVGSEVGFLGETSIISTVDPKIPTDDGPLPTDDPLSSLTVPPPQCASCVL